MIKKILRKLPFRIASWAFGDGLAIGTYNLKEPDGHLADTLLTVEKRTTDDAAVIRIDPEQARKLGIKIELYDYNLDRPIQSTQPHIEYKRYNTVDELTAGLGEYVNDCLTNAHGLIGSIDIKAEGVPSSEEWDAITTDEARKNAWDNAVGCYGIKAVGREFDSEASILVGAYYGTSNILTSKQFDFDTSDEEVNSLVRGLVVDLLTCCDDLQMTYLVRITETDEMPETMLL